MSDDIMPALPSKSEALDFTDRFRDALDSLCDAGENAAKFLRESQEIDYWQAAEYDSWLDWYQTEFEEQVSFLKDLKLSLDTRADIVESLVNGGLSNRQIAGTLGVNEKTVRNDLKRINLGSADLSAPGAEETAGQSVEEVGLIEDDEYPLPTVLTRDTVQWENIQKPEPKKEIINPEDRFAGINFDALILPTTSTQIIETDSSEDSKDYFTPRPVPSSWSPPQVKPLVPRVDESYDIPQDEPSPKTEIIPEPQKEETNHCRTCRCNLLP